MKSCLMKTVGHEIECWRRKDAVCGFLATVVRRESRPAIAHVPLFLIRCFVTIHPQGNVDISPLPSDAPMPWTSEHSAVMAVQAEPAAARFTD